MGFIKDTDYKGKEVAKPDEVSQEMRHRAKIISHELQCKLRRGKEEKAAEEEKRKKTNESIKRNKLLNENGKAIEEIFKNVPEEQQNLQDITIKHFKKVNVPLLKAFIRVRYFNTSIIPKGQASLLKKKKGTVESAEAGEDNLIRLAYDTRMKDVLMIRPDVDEDGNVVFDDEVIDEEVADDDVENDDVVVDLVEGGEVGSYLPRLIVELNTNIITPPHIRSDVTSTNPPSYFLDSMEYLLIAKTNIRGTFNAEILPIPEEKKVFVNKLGRMIHRRLAKHIRIKVEDPSKHNHPALLFVRENLNRFAALLYFFRQARESPVLNSKSCLLQSPSIDGFLAATDEQLEGSYLHYHSNECSFIRSGKAVGSNASNPVNGIVKRNDGGHRKKASTSSLVNGECFYTRYPSRQNHNQLPEKLGYFEDLSLYSGFCFKHCENTDRLTSVEVEKCLFDWSLLTNCLTTMNLQGCMTLNEKQLVVVGYFFELCYDICLSPSKNVSNNPGFESMLGVFNNNE